MINGQKRSSGDFTVLNISNNPLPALFDEKGELITATPKQANESTNSKVGRTYSAPTNDM